MTIFKIHKRNCTYFPMYEIILEVSTDKGINRVEDIYNRISGIRQHLLWFSHLGSQCQVLN